MTLASDDAPRAWRFAVALFAIAALLLLLSLTGADSDLWGHLRFGLDTLASRHVVETDPYSYLTFGQRWINHEWLAEMLFGAAWQAGGAPGLIALKMLVGFATIAMLFRHLLAFRLHPVQAVILLILIGTPVFVPFLTIRPQIFTTLLFSLLMIVIRKAEGGDYRWLWTTPPMMLAWINLHGGVLAGMGMLGLWTLLRLATHAADARRFLPPAFLAGLATLVNPYWADLPIFLLQTATGARPEIEDWRPLHLISIWGLTYLAIFGTTTWGLVRSGEPRNRRLLFLTAFVALLPLIAVRHLALFSIVALALAGDHVAAAWRKTHDSSEPSAPDFPRWVAVLPVAGAAALLGIGVAAHSFNTIAVNELERAPSAATALLARVPGPANVLTDYNWGEYVIWFLGPRIRVGMDGRRETVYSPELYERYLDFHGGLHDWSALLRTSDTDAALVKTGEPPYNLLELRPEWALVFQDERAALFVRRSSRLFEPLSAAAKDFRPPAPSRYFP